MVSATDPSEESERASEATHGASDPDDAAQPDDVIREPEDVSPDTSDDEGGEARRVDAAGETQPLDGGQEQVTPQAALVYNPIKVDAATLRAMVERLSERAGWEKPLFYETTVDDLGDDVTRQALEAGVDAVLVAGGDGTVRAVVEAMSESGVPLTIVPSGTGNLLARNLLLPLANSEAMVQATFTGDKLAIDVGFAAIRREDGTSEERAFVVMGGMGLDAAMIANTSRDLKKRVGWVAYVDGAARSLANAKPFRIMYQVPGRRLHSSKRAEHPRRQLRVASGRPGADPRGIRVGRRPRHRDLRAEERPRLDARLAARGVGQQRPAQIPRRPPRARTAHEGQLGASMPEARVWMSRPLPRSPSSWTATSSARRCACAVASWRVV